MNKKEIKLILNQLNITPKKNLGQNFLIDQHVTHKVIKEADLKKTDIILEIGTGLGELTSQIVSNVEKVYSYELDLRLFQYCFEKFANIENVEIINQDILKADLPYHNKVVSNIPYTITGPIFEKVFYVEKPPSGVLIIEKSIANRLFFSGKYKHFSRITVTFNAFMEPVKMSNIPSESFYPRPKIDLVLVKFEPRRKIDPFLLEKDNKNFFLNFIANIMPYKNKDLVNGLKIFFNRTKYNHISKREILEFLKKHDLDNIKIFQYNIDGLISLSSQIFNWLNKKL